MPKQKTAHQRRTRAMEVMGGRTTAEILLNGQMVRAKIVKGGLLGPANGKHFEPVCPFEVHTVAENIARVEDLFGGVRTGSVLVKIGTELVEHQVRMTDLGLLVVMDSMDIPDLDPFAVEPLRVSGDAEQAEAVSGSGRRAASPKGWKHPRHRQAAPPPSHGGKPPQGRGRHQSRT